MPSARSAAPAMALAAGLTLLAPAAASAGEPDYEAPFGCGQDWQATSRPEHSPSHLSVDFNRDDDYRAPVLASAPGVVTDVVDAGDTSYGKYVVVDHGRDRSTLYAHLDVQWVVEGQWVDQGGYIGLLGTSGGSTGPHLHFEQRIDRVDRHASFHGAQLRYDSTINSFNCGDVPVTGDWNGDRRTDVGIWHATPNGGEFRLRRPDGSVRVERLGDRTDRPVTGDWDGDGQTNVGVWNRRTGTFSLRRAGDKIRKIKMGGRRDLPITGDWNGDGRTDVGMFRPGKGTVRLRDAAGNVSRFRFGARGSVPLSGDFRGDRRADLAAYNVRTSTWTLRTTGTGRITTRTFGRAGALPVTGDWNGDGKDTLGTWRMGSAVFSEQREGKPTRIRFGVERR